MDTATTPANLRTTQAPRQPQPTLPPFAGLLGGIVPGSLQAWGVLEAVTLFLDHSHEARTRTQFVPPLQSMKIAGVPSYGTILLRNTSPKGILIAPMHVGFFQEGAQNHATSRVLIVEAGETLKATDCFCIQQAQGGLMREAQQRFLILPLGLRHQALNQRHTESFSRLWEDIDSYTRNFGITRGGHLERFLRPYFPQLMPFRHVLEAVPQQVGAAYFVAGQLVGVELAPNPTYWQDMAAILAIYCYGPSAIYAQQQGWQPARRPLNLDGLADLDDLAQRLATSRHTDIMARLEPLRALSAAPWEYTVEEDRYGLRVLTLAHDGWMGQMVREGQTLLYLSLFRDVIPRK